MRKLIAALLFALASASPAVAAVCGSPIPALPDSERRTEYTGIVAQTGPFNVSMQLYGDSNDYGNWLQVWVNGVQKTPVTDFVVTSPTGTLGSECLPISDAQVTFTAAQTGTIEIVGARRPRRASQFAEGAGVTAHALNQVITDLTATERERWDALVRTMRAPPGETLSVLPPVASRSNGFLAFDGAGNPIAAAAPTGTGTMTGPVSTTNGHLVSWASTNGTLTADLGIGAGLQSSGGNLNCISFTSVALGCVPASGGGTTNFLRADGTWANTAAGSILGSVNTWTADNYFQSGRPWFDVRAFGATGNGATNDTTSIQNAINAAAALGAGTVYFPPGNYCANGGITVTSGFILLKGGPFSQIADCSNANITTVTLNSQFSSVRDLTIVGPGMIAGAAPTGNALTIGSACTSCEVTHNLLNGGANALLVQSADTIFEDNVIGSSYGTAASKVTLSGYFVRNKVDQNYPVSIPSIGATPVARNNTTGYTTGQIVSLAGFYIQATNNGTSGGSPPTLLSYNTNITDGSVTWKLVAPTTYYGRQYDTNATQTFSWGEDFSGPFTSGIALTNTGAAIAPQSIYIDGGTVGQTLGSGISLTAGNAFNLSNSTISTCLINGCGGLVTSAAFVGDLTITNNQFLKHPIGIAIGVGTNTVINDNRIYGSSTAGINIAANIGDFSIIGNSVGSNVAWGANLVGINIAAGTSAHYHVWGNDTFGAGTTIVNGGSGVDQTVQGGQIKGTATNDGAIAGNIGETSDAITTSASATATFTNGSPIIGWTAHGLGPGSIVTFTTTGGLPTNFATNTNYYIIATGLTVNQFEVSATPFGGAITAGSAGTGTQTGTSFSIQTVSLTATDVAVTQITAGQWECSGSVVASGTGNGTAWAFYLQTVSNTFPAVGNRYRASQLPITIASGTVGIALPPQTFKVAATTNIFVGMDNTFSTGNTTGTGQVHCTRTR